MAKPTSRVLVVDDHVRNVAILEKILRSEYLVERATSGEEALSLATGFRPDVVLLDIMMPGIDGYETCRRLRACPELSHTKIILVSAKAQLSERLAGYEAGADDYVVKPFDQDELLVKLRVFMRLKSVEELNRLKSDMITLLTHETRTPLASILAPLEMLQSPEAGLSSRHLEMARIAHRGAVRLNEFIEGLGLLNDIQSGHVALELVPHDLAAIALSAVERASEAARGRQVTVQVDVQPGLVCDCDAGHLGWVLAALLDNATRFSPSPGVVSVRIHAQGATAVLSVADQGPGIPQPFLAAVFDGLTVPDIGHHHSGRGLSMVTARAILRRHEGEISAHNSPDGGAVFELLLPLSSEAAPNGTGSAAIPAPGSRTTGA